MKEVIANQTWNNFIWPDWVPDEIVKEVVDFWSDRWGRGPAEWYENAIHNQAPLFGDRVRVHGLGSGRPVLDGRFVFAWNNIGRLLCDDGTIRCVDFYKFQVSRDGMWRDPLPGEFANPGEVLPFYARNI